MIQAESTLLSADNTGAKLLMCIKVWAVLKDAMRVSVTLSK